jgi:hypothetical protein
MDQLSRVCTRCSRLTLAIVLPAWLLLRDQPRTVIAPAPRGPVPRAAGPRRCGRRLRRHPASSSRHMRSGDGARRPQSPPPPPPGSAVTSCSCFPVGRLGLTFDSQPSAVEGAWRRQAEKVAGSRGGVVPVGPGARGGRRASPTDAAPRLPARPGVPVSECGRRGALGRLGPAWARGPAAPFPCWLPPAST